MSKWNSLFSFLKKATGATNANDIPELTKFLKES